MSSAAIIVLSRVATTRWPSSEESVTDHPRIAHVGIAVLDLESALAFYRDVLGLQPHQPEVVDGATIVALPFGDADVELLAPVEADSPIGRFLARRGPGIHHICYRVPDLDAALEACRKAGYRLVDEVPRKGAAGRRIAFVHPKATAGILLELTD
jgi:methylmalonyl-CoA epimerase